MAIKSGREMTPEIIMAFGLRKSFLTSSAQLDKILPVVVLFLLPRSESVVVELSAISLRLQLLQTTFLEAGSSLRRSEDVVTPELVEAPSSVRLTKLPSSESAADILSELCLSLVLVPVAPSTIFPGLEATVIFESSSIL